ncbi:hypothetical protein ACL02U_13255 [Streptomyces sp. MS06]|uniref:hypothetical protein n=1 Tax=Streptomyces sp. MS06 TaxID=3385974 RepID=UPI0039A1A341
MADASEPGSVEADVMPPTPRHRSPFGAPIIAVVALALTTLGGYAVASHNDGHTDAASLARQGCTELGYNNSDDVDPPDDEVTTDWAAMVKSMRGSVDKMAQAAIEDPRWNRLSNAATDALEWAKQMATAQSTTDSYDQVAAQQQANQMFAGGWKQALAQECRKALVT